MNTFPPPLQQIDRVFVRFNGRKYLYFGGCDYFRLSSEPAVERALKGGLRRFGLNVAASRKTTGNHEVYGRLEKSLCTFFDTPAALLVPNGYLTNLAAAQGLAGEFSHVLFDERSHSSLLDAVPFFGCPAIRFAHRSPESLVSVIERIGRDCHPILLTDGMFSHDGSVAPLKAYQKKLPTGAGMLIDDAHGAGVLGKNGRGTVEYESIRGRNVIQSITLSKAFGVYGGAILGAPTVIRKIAQRSRLMTGSTPLPLPLASASLAAVRTLASNKRSRTRLHKNINYVKSRLKDCVAATPGPILAVVPRNRLHASALSRALLKAGIFPSFVQYPGGPETGYFRFAISSEHTRPQLDRLICVLLAAR